MIGDWRLEIGDWRLEIGDWRLVIGDQGFLTYLSLYHLNIQKLSEHFHVYSLDWFGVGASDRPRFKSKTVEETEEFFIRAFESWREAHRIERFSLLGHSFGE